MTAELVQDSALVVIAAGVLLDYTRRHGEFGLRVLRLLGEEVRAARRMRVETPRPRRVIRDRVRPR